jgi:hypothetical protein
MKFKFDSPKDGYFEITIQIVFQNVKPMFIRRRTIAMFIRNHHTNRIILIIR